MNPVYAIPMSKISTPHKNLKFRKLYSNSNHKGYTSCMY